MRYIYQWMSCQGCEAKERNRCPASKVSEDKQGHALGNGHVRTSQGCSCVLAAFDGAVHATVACTDHPEGQSIEGQKHHQVSQVCRIFIFHRQADTVDEQTEVALVSGERQSSKSEVTDYRVHLVHQLQLVVHILQLSASPASLHAPSFAPKLTQTYDIDNSRLLKAVSSEE